MLLCFKVGLSFVETNGRQTPSAQASILFSRTNLLYVPNIEMWRIVGSRSVHDFGSCKENAAAQCRLPIFKRVWPQDSSEFATTQRHPDQQKYSHCLFVFRTEK